MTNNIEIVHGQTIESVVQQANNYIELRTRELERFESTMEVVNFQILIETGVRWVGIITYKYN